MKKMLMVGDSVTAGYASRLAELLAEECAVVCPAHDIYYAGYTLGTLWHIREFAAQGFDLICWNAGVEDHLRPVGDGKPLVSAEEYLFLNRRLYRQIALYTDRLIWTNTTPAGEGYAFDPEGEYGVPLEEWNREIDLYNGLLSAYLEGKGPVVNDLYSAVAAHPEYLGPDGVHLSETGIEQAARQTAECVRRVLNGERQN